eukprot:SAG31_NODE_1170_length_9560_cov_3.537031_1_plen_143_part_00
MPCGAQLHAGLALLTAAAAAPAASAGNQDLAAEAGGSAGAERHMQCIVNASSENLGSWTITGSVAGKASAAACCAACSALAVPKCVAFQWSPGHCNLQGNAQRMGGSCSHGATGSCVTGAVSYSLILARRIAACLQDLTHEL